MDQLDITGLKISTKIGVHAWEQQILQTLLIDISIIQDLSDCQESLANTIDYDQLCQRITHDLESNAYALIETVANRVAQFIKEHFSVTQLTVRVSKPNAVKNASNVSVTVVR